MNKRRFDETKRRDVTRKDMEDALKSILLAPCGKVRSENLEPTKSELETRYRLDREQR